MPVRARELGLARQIRIQPSSFSASSLNLAVFDWILSFLPISVTAFTAECWHKVSGSQAPNLTGAGAAYSGNRIVQFNVRLSFRTPTFDMVEERMCDKVYIGGGYRTRVGLFATIVSLASSDAQFCWTSTELVC